MHPEPVSGKEAVEQAALVQAPGRGYCFSSEQAARLLETLKAVLPAEAFAVAAGRGKALDVAQMAQEALACLEQMEE